jgi:DNA-binding CsgD family transcriptional regulator
MTSRSASALREPPEYREFVASRLDPSGLIRRQRAGIPTPGSAVVIGEDGPHRRRVAASLRQGPWRVKRATGDDARAFAVVAVVESVAFDEAAGIVSAARELGEVVVVVIGEPTTQAVRELLDAGADAVLPVDAVETQLGPAMAAVQAGLVVAPAGVLAQSAGRPALTPREKQALAMVVLGFSNADIANKLYVAESTVKSHLSSAFAKLGVRTRSEATAVILDRSNGFGTGILAIVGDGDADSA